VAKVTEPLVPPSKALPQRRGVFLDQLTRSEAFRWTFIAVAGFLAGELISTALVEIAASLTGDRSQLSTLATSSSPPSWYIICSLAGLWVGLLGAAIVARKFGGGIKRPLGLSFRPIDLLGVIIGIGSQLIIGLLYLPFRSHIAHFDAPITKLTGSSHGVNVVVIIMMTVVGAPFFEELFFRGVLFRGLEGFSSLATKRIGALCIIAAAMVGDGLLFGLAHGEFVQLPGLALFGALLAFLFFRTGRLGMSIVAHLSFNGLALVSYYSSSGSVLPWH